MAGILMGVYGALTYLFFFATFLYAIAFVDDLPFAPKTLDSGPAGPLVPTLIIDAALLGLFAVQHSVMARPAFKRWWTKIVAPPIERTTYVLFASAALVVMYVFWRPLPATVWSVTPGPLATGLLTLSLIGWGIVLISTFLISHFELFGLAQVYNRLRGAPQPAHEFRTPAFYKLVRHPIYAGFIIAFWATPTMTVGHLIFAVGTLGYILVAIQLEEHDLVGVFGDRYRAYRQQVGMLLPKLAGGKAPHVAPTPKA
ncbi:MAG TPA: isoprenylcysteine carboxylmethyltransferase family protein [Caulobacteraceae bacterium]|nr:isoprenylcysteine carboxylmethyltransferase family protein [Caulobacteraceae bacterium]